MDRSNDRKKFFSFKNVAENALGADYCSRETCEDIFQRMQEKDIKKWVEDSYEAEEEDLVHNYRDLFFLVAKKFSELGAPDKALEAIAKAELYCDAEALSVAENMKRQMLHEPAPKASSVVQATEVEANKKAQEVGKKSIEKPQEQPVVPRDVFVNTSPTTKTQSPNPQAPVSPEPQQPTNKKNKNLLLIGGAAAAVVVLLAGVFAFSGGEKKPAPDKPDKKVVEQKVEKFNVSFDVPEGTKVIIDDNLVDAAGGVMLTKGKHSVKMEHPLFDLVYDKEINVTEAITFALVKDTKIGENTKALAKQVNTDMMNDILQQACNSNQMSFNPELYSSDADTNGKLTKAYEAMHNFASKKGVKNMSIEQTDLGKLELVNDGRQLLLKGTAELVGNSETGQKFSYSVYTVLEVKGDKLLVKSLESFKAKMLK